MLRVVLTSPHNDLIALLLIDYLNIGLGRYIESAADKLGLPDPKLSVRQAASTIARRVALGSGVVCITIG
jgi:hypothetical protein